MLLYRNHYLLRSDSPARSKTIEKDRNWGIGKDRTFLSLPTHHFVSPELCLFLSPHLSRVTGNIYLFLSLCLMISIFSNPLVYPWVIDNLYIFLSLIYLPIGQILISLNIPQYLFLPRNEECSSKKYCINFTYRGRPLLHWP